ncbi:hypothetical protein COE15_12010 [Bacillus cereus]|uniref:dienelactone hydrolase family protein n=1 Tax=unclassified Bacillus (in: firmicutes) TaxID=185979 RepID=UPI00047A3398|nr:MULTISPECIES: dienelactone hydrolase family protein [unclassified Bacillus (in: firmicutes)]PFE06236.1 hypothetical protein CN288_01295 [Bacillus sp. AFS023182]PGY01206.1 hypothetical protein COE15_12010 [Bacillus cereus]
MNQKVALIAIHEIYGVNEHMQDIVTKFSSQHVDVFCPNLLQLNSHFHYNDEQKAYSHFIKNVGFQHGKEQVEEIITTLSKKYSCIGLIGFSVGATISWLCSKNPKVNFVISCYGSRIRDYSYMIPTCPTLLIFPETELNCSVSSLIATLQEQNNPFLHIHQFPGYHGFLDPYTAKYNGESTKQAYEMIDSFLQKNVTQQVY